MLLLLDASTTSALGTILLLESESLFFLRAASGSVVFLLEYWIRLHGLELGLEVTDGVAMSAAIGTATSVGKVVTVVLCFFAGTAPLSPGKCVVLRSID